MPDAPPCRLALADGSIWTGSAFGAVGRRIVSTAEVVFNTAMCGYQESLTDPSYSGQILVATFPLIGNYGVNPADVESRKVQVAGFIVRELARLHSNYRAAGDLSGYLAESGVLGLTGIDTRALTRRLRTAGVMNGALTDRADLSDADLVHLAREAPSMDGQNLVPRVGCTSPQTWSETLGDWRPATPGAGGAPAGKPGNDRPLRVAAIDCGAKRNILRNLADRGCEVKVIPHTTSARDIRAMHERREIDGLFVSNGPGDPAAVEGLIGTLREVVGGPPERTIPTFGICLGHQLLSLALGARTFKLKFGHRGVNQPVLNRERGEGGRVEITSQNHGFAVDPASLPKNAAPTHVNLNDGTLAGFRMTDRPVFAVQHHPEASPGPHDASYLFDAFVGAMRQGR